MTDHEQLKTDVQRLYTWGAIKVPAVADQYIGIAASVYNTASADSAYQYAAMVPESFKIWCDFRDLLQSQILCKTANNLRLTGKSMERYAFELADDDDDLKNALINEAQQDLASSDKYQGKDPASLDPEALADDDPAAPPPDVTEQRDKPDSKAHG